ncbi:hypothetical protein K474DRAFT_924769 [Panus rudis PR-1116 ss-1]|nr:hypothetical protein K474DRAFT_924769 [Panus rudis PR-1116 ss-1]
MEPTLTNVRIRSVADCNRIFYAVSLGLLPLFTKRLGIHDRRVIHAGCIFVWEECNSKGPRNALRWTDGRRWSTSKVSEDFLFYKELLPDVLDDNIAQALRADQLGKQTYSVYIQTPQGRRKWHLVSYHALHAKVQLRTVDDVPVLANLGNVPAGLCAPARGRKSQRSQIEEYRPQTPISRSRSTSPPRRPGVSSSRDFRCPSPVQSDISDTAEYSAPSSALSSPSSCTGSLRVETPPPDPSSQITICIAAKEDEERGHRAKVPIMDSAHKLAPLVYMDISPYQIRQPFDIEALRSVEAYSRPL